MHFAPLPKGVDHPHAQGRGLPRTKLRPPAAAAHSAIGHPRTQLSDASSCSETHNRHCSGGCISVNLCAQLLTAVYTAVLGYWIFLIFCPPFPMPFPRNSIKDLPGPEFGLTSSFAKCSNGDILLRMVNPYQNLNLSKSKFILKFGQKKTARI